MYFKAIQYGDNSNKEFDNEQISVIEYLVAEKCKHCEIYRRICTEKHIVVKIFFKRTALGFSTTRLSWKDSLGWKILTLGKERVLRTEVNKEGQADRPLKHERIYHYWHPWKGSMVNSA